MKQKFYVYRFKNAEEIILYVGRTKNLTQRFKQHEHLTSDVVRIEYIECSSEAEMVWKEIYYINLFYNELSTNTADVYNNGKITDINLNDTWIEYNTELLTQSRVDYNISLNTYNSFLEDIPKYDYKNLIHILDYYKMNEIGKDKHALSEKWFSTNNELTKKIKNNSINFFRNIRKCYSQQILWTCYNKELIKAQGYTKGYVGLYEYNNIKGLYHERTELAYLANVFYPVNIKNPELTDDQYALYNLLNFIFQSGLYYGKEINIYIPSKRMRTLLEKWINEQNYEEV